LLIRSYNEPYCKVLPEDVGSKMLLYFFVETVQNSCFDQSDLNTISIS